MMQQKSRIKFTVAAVLWFVICNYLLFAPPGEISEDSFLNIPGMDKVVHFVLFAILTYLSLRAFKERSVKVKPVIIVCIFVVYAITTEVIQGYLSYRSSDSVDVLFNCLGIITVMSFFNKSLVK